MKDVPVPEPIEPSHRRDSLLLRIQPILTVIIAFTAIGLTIWEGVENRRHNRLSVLPRIGAEINSGRDSAGEYVRMTMQSTGLGPAVIKSFRVYFDGKLQDTERLAGSGGWQAALTAFSSGDSHISAHALGAGYFFPAGRQEVLFEATRSTPRSQSPVLPAILQRLAVQTCYCSVYGSNCDEVILTTSSFKPPSCLE